MMTRRLDTDTVYTLSRLFHLYVGAWRRAEREREERERERESLYRYKSQAHGDGLTEEEREERDMRENFPTFEQVRASFFDISIFVDALHRPPTKLPSDTLDFNYIMFFKYCFININIIIVIIYFL